MKHLLDVNVLLAAVWGNHTHNARAKAWLTGKSIVVCPITELGFLRVSTHPRAINAPMADARKALDNFCRNTGPHTSRLISLRWTQNRRPPTE